MSVDIERLAEAGKRQIRKMDLDDIAAMKVCLLAAGTLTGLALKGSFARRLAGTACCILTAGLAVPLACQYLDELKDAPAAPEPLDQENP